MWLAESVYMDALSLFMFTFHYMWPLAFSLTHFLSLFSRNHCCTPVITSPLSSFSLFFLVIPLSQYMSICGLSLPLPTRLFPPVILSSSFLLQVVKWILLSQSYQGKGRKRKRIDPKVNYKEVGDTWCSIYSPSAVHLNL